MARSRSATTRALWGLTRDPAVNRHTSELQAFMRKRGLVATGVPTLARYDPPWTPWFMRRNEVMIAVAREP
jgi:SOUL heme-binding protein